MTSDPSILPLPAARRAGAVGVGGGVRARRVVREGSRPRPPAWQTWDVIT